MKYSELPKVRIQLVKEAATDCKPGRRIITPESVYQVIKEGVELLDREHFYVLLLDIKNRVIGVDLISIGTLDHTISHPREVFKAAILANAAALIMIHNHPSGDPSPSSEDISLTDRLVAAGTILGIKVLDHVIIGRSRFASLRELEYLNFEKYIQPGKHTEATSLAIYGKAAEG